MIERDDRYPDWFTGRADCYFDSWLTPRLAKGQAVYRALQIGTYLGDASLWIVKSCSGVVLDDVDTWAGSEENAHRNLDFGTVESHYDERTAEYRASGQIDKYKMTSDEFFDQCDQTYDFIYVDGDHTASQVHKDAMNAHRHLKVGGVLVFDDYGWASDSGDPQDTPKPAIDDFLEAMKSNYQILTVAYQVWLEKVSE